MKDSFVIYTRYAKHIEKLRNVRIRRIGADKGGYWEVIE